MQARMAEAMRQAVIGAAEMIGAKDKNDGRLRSEDS